MFARRLLNNTGSSECCKSKETEYGMINCLHDVTVTIFNIVIFLLCYIFGLSFYVDTIFGSKFMTSCTSNLTGNFVIKKQQHVKLNKNKKEKGKEEKPRISTNFLGLGVLSNSNLIWFCFEIQKSFKGKVFITF